MHALYASYTCITACHKDIVLLLKVFTQILPHYIINSSGLEIIHLKMRFNFFGNGNRYCYVKLQMKY